MDDRHVFLLYDREMLAVYLIVNLDEMIKLPAVYRHYKKYKWVKNLTAKGDMTGKSIMIP